jgi:hypothetical protein
MWRESGCQPNYWCNVVPDSSAGCGPYRVSHLSQRMTDNKCEISDGTDSEQCGSSSSKAVGFQNHDTISMAVIDKVVKLCTIYPMNFSMHVQELTLPS